MQFFLKTSVKSITKLFFAEYQRKIKKQTTQNVVRKTVGNILEACQKMTSSSIVETFSFKIKENRQTEGELIKKK